MRFKVGDLVRLKRGFSSRYWFKYVLEDVTLNTIFVVISNDESRAYPYSISSTTNRDMVARLVSDYELQHVEPQTRLATLEEYTWE